MPVIPEAPPEICEFFGSRYCIPVGSGTTGLYIALTALGTAGGKVIIPERTCPNVAVAVLAAGGIPVPVGIDARNYNISPAEIARAVDRSTKAVLAISSFGYPVAMREIRQAVGSYDVPIIDDACQAYGGTVDGVRIGDRGDIGVVSFGYAKPVDAGSGGLILTDSTYIAAQVSRALTGIRPGLTTTFKNFVLQALMRTSRFNLAARIAKSVDLLRYPMPARAQSRLQMAWVDFVNEIPQIRYNLKQVDKTSRQIEGVVPFDYEWSLNWLPWRYSFKTSSQSAQREIISFLGNHGIESSTLYRPIADCLEIGGPPSTKDRDPSLDRVVNLKYEMTAESTGQLRERLESALLVSLRAQGKTGAND